MNIVLSGTYTIYINDRKVGEHKNLVVNSGARMVANACLPASSFGTLYFGIANCSATPAATWTLSQLPSYGLTEVTGYEYYWMQRRAPWQFSLHSSLPRLTNQGNLPDLQVTASSGISFNTVFLCDNQSHNSFSGTLFSITKLPSSYFVAYNDTLRIQYTLDFQPAP